MTARRSRNASTRSSGISGPSSAPSTWRGETAVPSRGRSRSQRSTTSPRINWGFVAGKTQTLPAVGLVAEALRRTGAGDLVPRDLPAGRHAVPAGRSRVDQDAHEQQRAAGGGWRALTAGTEVPAPQPSAVIDIATLCGAGTSVPAAFTYTPITAGSNRPCSRAVGAQSSTGCCAGDAPKSLTTRSMNAACVTAPPSASRRAARVVNCPAPPLS